MAKKKSGGGMMGAGSTPAAHAPGAFTQAMESLGQFMAAPLKRAKKASKKRAAAGKKAVKKKAGKKAVKKKAGKKAVKKKALKR